LLPVVCFCWLLSQGEDLKNFADFFLVNLHIEEQGSQITQFVLRSFIRIMYLKNKTVYFEKLFFEIFEIEEVISFFYDIFSIGD